MEYLVGDTGFVGSNLKIEHEFGKCFHSTNIQEAYGGHPDLLVYSGIRAEMYLANLNPTEDQEGILEAIKNIENIAPKKMVLISTSVVYPEPEDVTEDTKIDKTKLTPYGKNRYELEQWVQANVKDYLIIRLPALYGKNIKKNFLYDFIHYIPELLNREKFSEICKLQPQIRSFYREDRNGFYRCITLNNQERNELKGYFKEIGFSALNFTDSRSQYQFYNLSLLWKHICIAMNNGLTLLNITTEPISVSEVYQYLTGEKFLNELGKPYYKYNIKSKYFSLFHGKDGYLLKKDFVLKDIQTYVEQMKRQL